MKITVDFMSISAQVEDDINPVGLSTFETVDELAEWVTEMQISNPDADVIYDSIIVDS